MTQQKPGRLIFSTDTLPEADRLRLWSDGFVHRQMEMEFIDRSTCGLRFTVEFIPLGGVAAGIVRGTPSSFIRRPSDTNDGLYVVINRSGVFDVGIHGQRMSLPVGAAAVFDNRRKGELHCIEEGETWSVSVPREALRHLVEGLDKDIERFIPASNSTLQLLNGYLSVLFALPEVTEPELSGVHIADILASLLGTKRGSGSIIDRSENRAANTQAILDAIQSLSADPDIDAVRVAAQLGISVRYLHLLLEDTGKSFTEHVLERRVECAHRLLRDPRMASRKISDIAAESGFSDLSHFNRSIKRWFDATPSDIRENATRKENEV